MRQQTPKQIAAETALRSAKETMELMLRGKVAFEHIPNGKKHLNKLLSIKSYLEEEGILLPWMISCINDQLFEYWNKGLGIMKKDPLITGAPVHHDMKKTIRY